ncbi:uncharacterized protein C19orf44 homolog [Synchiropus splendidus]|uniref:uncharacterized protein C19orf44 homolog n=1 Tax=Synchiropus splendidus TaxID=270530 RepID=UPI00237E9846|nr:uncharacterized protein C19orf44 homolog [Synchiropus splendidus]
MWRRGGHSRALDRAEALLSSRGHSDAAAGVTKASPVKAPAKTVAAVSGRSSLKAKQPALSDLSDLSSISVPSELGLMASANVQNTQGREETVGGAGSRFLKKPSTLAMKSSPSSLGKSQPEPRSTQLSSQTAALRRLAQIESRFQITKQVQEPRNQDQAPVHHLQAYQSPVPTAVPQASLETKNRFLKKKPSVAADPSTSGGASGAFKSRTEGAEVEASGKDLSGLNYHMSLSDEEDIRELLGSSVDSSDDSVLGPTSTRKVNQSDASKAPSLEPSPASVSKSSNKPLQSPASPALCNSPFRFTGLAHSHYSPSAASPTPSPPISEILPHSVSPASARENVLSLDELFPAEHTERSSTPSHSRHHIKVMGLDQLASASPAFTEADILQDITESPVDHQHTEVEEVHYYSDFESETHTAASQVSEHVPEEIEAVETMQEDNASFTTRCESSSHTSHQSPVSRSSSRNTSSDSRHSLSGSSSTLTEKLFKEAAVQTHPEPLSASWSAGLAAAISAGQVSHTTPLAAQNIQALQSFNPAGKALHEVLQQQLVMMRSFIERSRHLHASLMQSLEPPTYRYTTLEDTMKSIRQHRKSQLQLKDT